MYRKTITKSSAGHYALTIRFNGARVFHRALITNLTTAQQLAVGYIKAAEFINSTAGAEFIKSTQGE